MLIGKEKPEGGGLQRDETEETVRQGIQPPALNHRDPKSKIRQVKTREGEMRSNDCDILMIAMNTD